MVVVLTADPPVSAADRALLASLPSTALRTFVLERLQRIPEVKSTQTMFILDEPHLQ